MLSTEEVYGKVVQVLAASLNRDEGDITPTATLQGDLGAESIDFLDIVFRLEREFAIKIPRGELFPEAIFQNDPDFVKEGLVTDRGICELRLRMPFADLRAFEQDRRASSISNLFTVGLVVRYVAWKLDSGEECGPNEVEAIAVPSGASAVQSRLDRPTIGV
jgi:acyl carrier protein